MGQTADNSIVTLSRLSVGSFAALFFAPLIAQLILSATSGNRVLFESAPALFVLFVVAASGATLLSFALVMRGWLSGVAELAWTGLFFLGVSSTSLVHGALVPDVLFEPSPAFGLTALLAGPIGLIAASPLLAARHGSLARAWRAWTVAWVMIITALFVTMLVARDSVPQIEARSVAGVALLGGTACGVLLLSLRQVELARIAERKGPLIVAFGYSLVVGSIGSMFIGVAWSTPFWIAQVLTVAGAAAGVVGALVLYRPSPSMNAVLAPVTAIEPLAVLEASLTPEVGDYIAALDAKDPLTRDHVIRTTELALEVGEYMRLTPESRRVLALTAALHDIGKIAIPGELLNKPGVLSDDEWKVMRSHAALGGEMLASSRALQDLAPAVRAHHERIDGTGYPDNLSGDEIPLEAQIVAVCDAFDAMAYTRRYRSAMPLDEVISILREHAGSQWDPLIVHAVVAVVSRRRSWEPQLLSDERQPCCDCLPQEMAQAAREAEAQLPVASAFSAQVSLH